jgi:hypothetical protein
MQLILIPVIYAHLLSQIVKLVTPPTTASPAKKDTTPILQQTIHAQYVLVPAPFALLRLTATTAPTLRFSP